MSDAAVEPTPAVQERGPPRKRRRLLVSCTECHRRKQKCDRDLPCANCRSRNKESYCTYERNPKATDKKPISESTSPGPPTKKDEDGSLSSVAAALGYSQTGISTMGFLQRIETETENGSTIRGSQPKGPSGRDSIVVKEKFKDLIRQLPAKTYLDRLIDIFMTMFNWQYYSIDPDVFQQQLEQWNRLPFKLLSTTGPQGLPPDMRAFPAVLFQVAATALLIVPEGQNSEFEALKYAGNMTFEDLATDYSESGAAVVTLFDKRSLTVTTVQAEFLRAAFLKFVANVTESWHAIAVAIRDAQELGMHRDSMDPKPADSSAESAIENEWLIQRRRKMYLILAVWDSSMSVLLGRPAVINWRHGYPSAPVDTAVPKDRWRTPVTARDEWREPPTPLAGVLWLQQLHGPLCDIQDLERDGPHPKVFSKIDRIHQRIMETDEKKPAIFRVENPDTRWDANLSWIQFRRYHFASLHAFSLMALHRPYIFQRRQSRDEALEASLQILEMTRQMFQGLPPDHWRNHNLFFGSFDALVMLSAIYILFPKEYPDLKQDALQQFHWAIERFSAMQERNPLARSAQGVLRAILAKFTKAISSEPSLGPSSATPASTRGATGSTTSRSSGERGFGDQGPGPLLMGQGIDPALTGAAAPTGGGEWAMPSMDVLASIAPMYPTSDLIFNDLDVVDGGTCPLTDVAALTGADSQQQQTLPWQFGGGIRGGHGVAVSQPVPARHVRMMDDSTNDWGGRYAVSGSRTDANT